MIKMCLLQIAVLMFLALGLGSCVNQQEISQALATSRLMNPTTNSQDEALLLRLARESALLAFENQADISLVSVVLQDENATHLAYLVTYKNALNQQSTYMAVALKVNGIARFSGGYSADCNGSCGCTEIFSMIQATVSCSCQPCAMKVTTIP